MKTREHNQKVIMTYLCVNSVAPLYRSVLCESKEPYDVTGPMPWYREVRVELEIGLIFLSDSVYLKYLILGDQN